MNYKFCNSCSTSKPVTDFNKKKDKYQSKCRACDNAYTRAHYKANKLSYIERTSKRKLEQIALKQKWVLDYFKNNPCIDCNESDPVVLEFDHLLNKSGNVSKFILNSSLENLIKEIEKCEVVCANCHRRRTAKQQNWYKLDKGKL